MSSALCLTVSLLIRAGQEGAALAALEPLAKHSRREPDCLAYEVHRAQDEPRRFFIYEIYRSAAALDAHHKTPHFIHYATGQLYPLIEERSMGLYDPVFLGERGAGA